MNYHNIIHCDMRDGTDIGVELFVSGCNHNCPGCHNPQTHDPCSGIFFDDKAKQEIMEELSKDWCHRLTLSGGDPLFPNNRKDILDLVTEVKEKFPNKKIWMYTGYVYEEITILAPRWTRATRFWRVCFGSMWRHTNPTIL